MVGRRRPARGDRAGPRGGLSQGLGEAVGYLRVAKRPRSGSASGEASAPVEVEARPWSADDDITATVLAHAVE